MEKRPLTEGEKRVRKSFNPSALKRVEEFKTITASAIDEIAEVERRVKNASKDHPELGDFLRECATAKTTLQDASMWGVCALTHVVVFDALITRTSEAQSALLPHQQRVVTEREELGAKCAALNTFISDSPLFPSLVQEEQDDLKRQLSLMSAYLDILDSRISRFSKTSTINE